MTQKKLDEFIVRAGFTYGWKNLESQARRQAEKAVEELAAQEVELDYLRWWVANADFGPASGDVEHHMRLRYTEDTGKPVPKGWTGDE